MDKLMRYIMLVPGQVLDMHQIAQSWVNQRILKRSGVGNRHISVSVMTGLSWCQQTLVRHDNGQYILIEWNIAGVVQVNPRARTTYTLMNAREAARWLVLNSYRIPDDLLKIAVQDIVKALLR